MYAQAVRIPPVHPRGKRIQSSAFAQCAKGCAFPDVQLDCIKYLKLGDPVCGSAHCQIADYWSCALGKKEIKAYQASRRGGYLDCVMLDNGRIAISGEAALVAVTEIVAELK